MSKSGLAKLRTAIKTVFGISGPKEILRTGLLFSGDCIINKDTKQTSTD